MSHSRDGEHDFDDETGVWHTRLSVLRPPLGASGTWLDFEGTTVVTPVWDGAANLVQLDAAGAAGEVHALSLRLYDTQSSQWHLHFASRGAGDLSPAVIGAFDGAGRGEFRSVEVIDGRPVEVLFVIDRSDVRAWRFEQSFSVDGGATWATNWVAVDTARVQPEQGDSQPASPRGDQLSAAPRGDVR